MNRINVCGISYEIKECDNVEINNDGQETLGMLDVTKGIIYIKKDMREDIKQSVIYHEIVHAIFYNLGYSDLYENEQLVQALSNTIYQTFNLCVIKEEN